MLGLTILSSTAKYIFMKLKKKAHTFPFEFNRISLTANNLFFNVNV